MHLVVSRHFASVASGPSTPFLKTDFFMKGLYGSYSTAYNGISFESKSTVGTFATFVARIRGVGECNFASTRMRHTGSGVVDTCRGTTRTTSAHGGTRCIHPLLGGFCRGSSCLRPRVTLRFTRVVYTRLGARVLGRFMTRLASSGGAVVLCGKPRGRNLVGPARRRFGSILTTIGITRVTTGTRRDLGRPFVDKGLGNSGIGGAERAICRTAR